jgi:hypothetical protein
MYRTGIELYAQWCGKDLNEPKIYEWFEYLCNEMKKREQTGMKNG